LSPEPILVTAFDDEDAARAALRDEDGVFAGCREGQAILDLSPITPQLFLEIVSLMARRGVRVHGAALEGGRAYVDDSVLADPQAEKAVRAAAPVVRATGAPGSSKAMAIVECMLTGVVAAAGAEAIALGVAAGVDADVLVKLLLKGSGGNQQLRGGCVVRDSQRAIELVAAQRLGRQVGHSVYFGSLALAVGGRG